MTCFFRPLIRTILIVFATFFPTTMANSQNLSFQFSTPSGSFLAGQEAFSGLATTIAADSLLQAALAQSGNAGVMERSFAALIADGRIADAEIMAKNMLELAPNSSLANLVLATIALKERRYSSVINQLDDMGLADFVDISAIILRAWARVGQSRLDKAMGELEELDGGGLSDFIVFHKALMADVAGDSSAIELARISYENEPFLGRMVEFYTRVLGNSGLNKAALTVLDDFEKEGLSHPSVGFVRGEIEAGRLPGKYAATVTEGASELFQGIGVALGRDGSTDIALVFLRLGLYLNPDADTISLTIAQFLEDAHRYEAANEIYRSIDEDSLFKSDAIVRIAQNMDALGDRPGAIERLKTIVFEEPENLEAITALGNLLRLDEQFDSSAFAFSRAIALVGGDHPRDWRFFYLRGIANERRGAWPAAEKDFLRALELNPTQAQVLNYLGYSWVEMGINLDQALVMIEQAVSTNPQDGYIVDSLGWAQFQMNNFDVAVVILEQAVRLSPNDPEINDHLGDAYWRVGRRNEARFQWSIVTSVDKSGDIAAEALVKLENGLPDIADQPSSDS
ncbi:MAG: tetratricopeptide repeat protein [Devosiaceae bacterium]|nr:tetratricopeptide repeat protein [Devosiaceae bacterium]